MLAAYLDGVHLREQGDLDGAVVAIERAHILAPDDADLTLELARAYDAARLYGAADVAFAEAALLAPGRVDVQLARARFHVDHAFRVREGAAAAERAAALAPDDPALVALLDRARAAAALSEPWGHNLDTP